MQLIRRDFDWSTQHFRHLSDLHIGSADTRVDLIERELDADDSWLLFNGDMADLIIAADKKRYRPACLPKRLRGRNDIINATLDWTTELLEPHAKRILGLGTGNHETAIEKECSLDFARLLCDRLGVPYAGYSGYYDFRFRDDARHVCRYLIHYHHGAGGGASLKSCVDEFTKRNGYIDADLIWVGHRHHNMSTRLRRLVCPILGSRIQYSDTRFIMTAAYMESWKFNNGPREGSYPEDKALPPQPTGGTLVTVSPNRNGPPTIWVTT